MKVLTEAEVAGAADSPSVCIDWLPDLLVSHEALRRLAKELARMATEALAFCEPDCQHPLCVRDRGYIDQAREAGLLEPLS